MKKGKKGEENARDDTLRIKKISEKKQIKQENKILKIFIFGIIGFILVIVLFALFMNSLSGFEHEGVKFNVVKEGELILYRTALPVIYRGEEDEYNFYLRNDPRKLNVSFEGSLDILENVVINETGNFICGGDGVIAIANIVNLYKILGTDVIKDDTADCDIQGRYMFIRLRQGNETSIEEFGPACYNININNCEILEGTERFMIETFIEVNKLI